MAVLTTETKQKIANYRDEFLEIFPNKEQVDNPDYPTNPSAAEYINKYTDSQWIDEVVRRYLVKMLKRGDKRLQERSIADKTFDDIT